MKFLVAVDGSDEAENALAYASEIAEAVGASVTAVHAVDPAVYEQGGSEPISTLSDADQRLIIESIEDAEDRAIEIIEDAAESDRPSAWTTTRPSGRTWGCRRTRASRLPGW